MSATGTDAASPWAGLGLEHGKVVLREVRPEWRDVGRRLADEIRAAFGARAVHVEHVGSTAVPGLVAKPIVDLAVGPGDVPVDVVREVLEALGYTYRGDAGEQGGLVFVLEDRPRHRVAHVHVVEHAGRQWRRYLAFRDLLLRDASARVAYARLKLELARRYPNDRTAYTAAKVGLVNALLERDAQLADGRRAADDAGP